MKVYRCGGLLIKRNLITTMVQSLTQFMYDHKVTTDILLHVNNTYGYGFPLFSLYNLSI